MDITQRGILESNGRLVIPIDIRKKLKIEPSDSIEIYTTNGENIVLKKYIANSVPTCVICGESRSMYKFKEKYLCKSCISKLRGEKRNDSTKNNNSDMLFTNWK